MSHINLLQKCNKTLLMLTNQSLTKFFYQFVLSLLLMVLLEIIVMKYKLKSRPAHLTLNVVRIKIFAGLMML